jgi:3-hydroxymyristoyl/3-hydroxydecanoyl-(acyl carrier protein) dehydratase
LQLAAVKFRRPVRPGAVLTLHFESLADGGLRFVAREDGQPVVDGTARRD